MKETPVAMRNCRIVLWVVGLALPCSAWAELVDRIAAVVNNDIITLSELESRLAPELRRLTAEPDPKKRSEVREQLLKRGLDDLIGERLMEAQVRELGLEAGDAEVDLAIEDVLKRENLTSAQFEAALAQEGFSLATYRPYVKKHILKEKLIALKVKSKIKVTDEDLKAEYAKLAQDEAKDYEVRARHIVVEVSAKATDEQVEAARQKATALAAEARKPGTDFAALAKKKSEGPSAADGGDLGYFPRGHMMAAFDKVAFSLPVGGVSDPVRTQFGWHVVKVEEHRTRPTRPFDEVKDELRMKVGNSQVKRFGEQYVQELRAVAVVETKL